ncbi:hypothetical protein BU15DRAFT_67469 [Melanogaster broomeanus]|nr:hypothetical protein BU15DRAFT_67469 [Melanogaster broomeanus]
MVVHYCERADEDLVGMTRKVRAACLAWRNAETERGMSSKAQPWIRARAEEIGFIFTYPGFLDLRYLFRRQYVEQRGDKGASVDTTAAVDDGGRHGIVEVTAVEDGYDGCGDACADRVAGGSVGGRAAVTASMLPGWSCGGVVLATGGLRVYMA